MKTLSYKLIQLILFTVSLNCYGSFERVNEYILLSFQKDTITSIQKKIDHLFSESIAFSNTKRLEEYKNELSSNKENYSKNRVRYWQAYLQYKKAVFHLVEKNVSASEKSCDAGIDLLRSIKEKSTEDYALIALLESFSIQFKGAKVLIIAPRLKKNARRALALDSLNLRAYYVLGNNDYFTPQKYGGGKKVEFYLKKALAISPKKEEDTVSPTWGREESYVLLAQYYFKNDALERAEKTIKEGLSFFPKNHQLKTLLNKI
jgi:hypothetical protein